MHAWQVPSARPSGYGLLGTDMHINALLTMAASLNSQLVYITAAISAGTFPRYQLRMRTNKIKCIATFQ